MGNPDIFYKRALQNLAHCLAAENNDGTYIVQEKKK